MKPHLFKAEHYLWIYQRHRQLGVLCIRLILIAVAGEIFRWLNPGWSNLHLISWAAYSVLALAVISGLAWLWLCSWFCVFFRDIWFSVVSGLGALRKWANSGWRMVARSSPSEPCI